MKKKKNWLQILATKNEIGTLLPLVIMCTIVTIINPNFIAFDNLMEGKYFIDYYYAEEGRNTPDGGSLSPFKFGRPWRAPNDTVRVSNGENVLEKLLPDLPALP